jgi:hypothetical protein
MIYLIEKCNAEKTVLCTLLMFILYFCPGQFSCTLKAFDLKLHKVMDLNEKKCSAQDLVSVFHDLLTYTKKENA